MDYARLVPRLYLLSFALALTVGCMDGDEPDPGDGLTAADEQCVSGTAWVGGNVESVRMHPGRDCLACHQTEGEAEEVTLAGTVFDGLDEPDDCFGVEGVTLQLTDANGSVIEVVSNEAGNFVLENTTVVTPYTAKLVYEGRERVMSAPQTVLSCNACHGATGLNGAPGRILAP